MTYTETQDMAGDVFTKAFTDVNKWAHATKLINHIRLQGGKTTSETRKLAKPAPKAKVPQVKAMACKEKTVLRNLIEYCCGDDSLLGQATEISEGCNTVRLTEKLDVTSQGGKQLVDLTIQNSIKNKPHLVFGRVSPAQGVHPGRISIDANLVAKKGLLVIGRLFARFGLHLNLRHESAARMVVS